jgi:CubicO group peptidase (beta-lactamase class C family)
MEETTICRTQSISKSLTAWGVMALVESGKLDLESPITNYLDEGDLSRYKNDLKKITIGQLLSNSSGLSTGTVGIHYDPRKNIPTLRENLTKEIKFIEKPNEKFIYSNTGFNLLELIIENVTGEDFNNYMTREILVPLQMTNSTYEMTDEILKQLPYGYDLKNNEVLPYIYPEKASGGLYSTTGDLAKFLRGSIQKENNNEILNEDMIGLIQSPAVKTKGIYSLVSDDYGYGNFIEYFDDKKALFHGGQGHGWMTHYHLVPADGNGIIILTNSQRSWPFISQISTQWSQHYGYDLKMSRILLGISLLKMIVFLIVAYSIWQMISIFRIKNKQDLDNKPYPKATKIVIAVSTLFLLLWSLNLDYIFIESVFPKMYQWLRISLLFLSVSMISNYITTKIPIE